MYQLTIISGPRLGTQFPMSGGKVSIGRQNNNTVVLQSAKISKVHCVIDLRNDSLYLSDPGSSNGTFVNGMLVKSRVLKVGDRISIGEYILEVGHQLSSSTVSANPFSFSLSQAASASSIAAVPGNVIQYSNQAIMHVDKKDIKSQIIAFFETNILSFLYNLNIKNELRWIVVLIFFAFIITNLLLSLSPLMIANEANLVSEIGSKAQFMARQVAQQNTGFLATGAETRSSLGIVEGAPGVKSAFLIDLDSRILAPGSKFNQYLAIGSEALAAIRGREAFRAGNETGFYSFDAVNSLVIAVEPIKVLNPILGKNIVVGMAIVSIDSALSMPNFGDISLTYAQAFILSVILGFLILFVIYRITLKPLETLNDDMNKALKGDIEQVPYIYQFEEIATLWDLINSALQRIPKSGGFDGLAEGAVGNISADYVGPLKTLGNLFPLGWITFDSEQKILLMNSPFEELSGMRADSAVGHLTSEVARDQALGAMVSDLLGRLSAGAEGLSEDFDFSGVPHKIHGVAFGSSGGHAHCYVLLAIRAEV